MILLLPFHVYKIRGIEKERKEKSVDDGVANGIFIEGSIRFYVTLFLRKKPNYSLGMCSVLYVCRYIFIGSLRFRLELFSKMSQHLSYD